MSTNLKRSNVILTGFMGTGKSTVGVILSRNLDKEFVDTDIAIEQLYGSIPQIFSNEGEDAFRLYEREVSKQLAERENLVVATGGKLLLDPVNAERFSSSGRIFCLSAPASEIIDRLREEGDQSKRPLLREEDFENRIEDLFNARRQAYSIFEQVDTTGLTPSEVAKEIANRISK
tara:strand:- start:133 stop:657 length:525 start_codon:yes stop_codon:yes gene_type:complete